MLFANSPAFLQKRIQELESLVRGVEEKAGIGAPIYRAGYQFLCPRPENPTSVSNVLQSVFSVFCFAKHFINITRPLKNLVGFLFFIYL